jgi:hypothetical protein
MNEPQTLTADIPAPRRIAVIEADAGLSTLLAAHHIQAMGYEPHSAASGEEGLAAMHCKMARYGLAAQKQSAAVDGLG